MQEPFHLNRNRFQANLHSTLGYYSVVRRFTISKITRTARWLATSLQTVARSARDANSSAPFGRSIIAADLSFDNSGPRIDNGDGSSHRSFKEIDFTKDTPQPIGPELKRSENRYRFSNKTHPRVTERERERTFLTDMSYS